MAGDSCPFCELDSCHGLLDAGEATFFFCDVLLERARADQLHPGTADLPDSTDNPGGRRTWETIAKNRCNRAAREGRLTFAHVFDEEAAEVLAAAAEGDVAALEKELVQVAAVCLKWAQAIARRRT